MDFTKNERGRWNRIMRNKARNKKPQGASFATGYDAEASLRQRSMPTPPKPEPLAPKPEPKPERYNTIHKYNPTPYICNGRLSDAPKYCCDICGHKLNAKYDDNRHPKCVEHLSKYRALAGNKPVKSGTFRAPSMRVVVYKNGLVLLYTITKSGSEYKRNVYLGYARYQFREAVRGNKAEESEADNAF